MESIYDEAIHPQDTVGAVVRRHPGTSRVFEELRIDYCCGGKKPLSQACNEVDIQVDAVIDQLHALIGSPLDVPGQPERWTMPGLIENIVDRHHRFLDDELPRLTALAKKVAAAHGTRDPRLLVVQRDVHRIASDLAAHMKKEELVLFPMIQQLAKATPGPWFSTSSIQGPIDRMEAEHLDAGAGLADLRTLMENFTPPQWACNSYRALLSRLNDVELDLHLHVHKENNILFPMALEAERALR